MSKRKSNFKVFYFLFFLLLLSSCNTKEEENTSEKDEEKVKIGKVNFYLENSASMKGYLNNETQFKDIISSFISDFNNINICLISESIKSRSFCICF
jgi:hypothetical protein